MKTETKDKDDFAGLTFSPAMLHAARDADPALEGKPDVEVLDLLEEKFGMEIRLVCSVTEIRERNYRKI